MSLEKEEAEVLQKLYRKLHDHHKGNFVKEEYYEGVNRFKNLNISTPKQLNGLEVGLGWGEVVVESLNDRINLDGVSTENEYIRKNFVENNLEMISGQGHRDALIFGSCFLLVQAGDKSQGEPETIITPESPLYCTSVEDRAGNTKAFLKLYKEDGEIFGSLITPFDNIYMKITEQEGKDYVKVDVLSRDNHNLGFVPVVKLVNKPRASKLTGRSEIDTKIRRLIDEGIRTYVAAITSREFYAAPQKYILNIDPTAFQDDDGNSIDAWSAYMDKVLVAGSDEDGNTPVVGQFQTSSPEPFLKLIKQYATEISSIKGIPLSSLGYQTGQSPSAESLEVANNKLIKSAEDRTQSFGLAWQKIMKYSAMIAGEYHGETIRMQWRNPRTTSTGSSLVQADGIAKLIAAGTLQADSEVVYNLLGIDQTTIEQVRSENSKTKFERINAEAENILSQESALIPVTEEE